MKPPPESEWTPEQRQRYGEAAALLRTARRRRLAAETEQATDRRAAS